MIVFDTFLLIVIIKRLLITAFELQQQATQQKTLRENRSISPAPNAPAGTVFTSRFLPSKLRFPTAVAAVVLHIINNASRVKC